MTLQARNLLVTMAVALLLPRMVHRRFRMAKMIVGQTWATQWQTMGDTRAH